MNDARLPGCHRCRIAAYRMDHLHRGCAAAGTVLSIFDFGGLAVEKIELQDEALREMVRQIQGRLLGTEIMAGMRKIDLAGFDLAAAKQMAKAALAAIERDQLG